MSDIKEEQSHKGRPTECKYCGHMFHKTDLTLWEKDKHSCPSCGEIWCDKPETERMLMIIQDEYLYQKNIVKNPVKAEKALTEMIKILYSYVQSVIKKNFSNKIQESGKLEDYTEWAVSKTIEEYLARPDFKIWGSFKGIFFRKIQEAIFGKQEHACAEESLDFEFDDGHIVSYGDSKPSLMDSLRDRHEREQLVNTVCNLIYGVSEYCTQEEYYIALLNFRNYIIGGEKYTDRFFDQYEDKTGKMMFLDICEIVKEELRKLDRENH